MNNIYTYIYIYIYVHIILYRIILCFIIYCILYPFFNYTTNTHRIRDGPRIIALTPQSAADATTWRVTTLRWRVGALVKVFVKVFVKVCAKMFDTLIYIYKYI